MLTATMFAVKGHQYSNGEEFFDSIEDEARTIQDYYPPGDDHLIYEIEVSQHPDQSPVTITSGFQIDYWGWLATGEMHYSMVYPSFPQFDMCFAGGFRAEEELGRGKACRLQIKVVSSFPDDRNIH